MRDLAGHWAFWALLSAAFAALTTVFAKLGVSELNPDLATFLRTLVILGVLGVLVSATGQWQPLSLLSPKGLGYLVLSGLGTGASWLCYFRALKLGDAARVAPLDKLSVVFVALFATLVLGEVLSLKAWLGVGLIGLGAVLVALG